MRKELTPGNCPWKFWLMTQILYLQCFTNALLQVVILLNFYLYYPICSFKWTFEPFQMHFPWQTTYNCGNFPINVSAEGFEIFSCLIEISFQFNCAEISLISIWSSHPHTRRVVEKLAIIHCNNWMSTQIESPSTLKFWKNKYVR